jgi:hypothetical protein
MARARNIKPGLFKNEILGVADPLYTILFEGLWVLADREGRLEDRPLRIKAEILPYREGVDVEGMLTWLAQKGFIARYTAEGKSCIQILEFVKHQNPHKNESESELPAYAPENHSVSSDSESLSSDSLNLIPDSLTLTPAPASPPPRRAKTRAADEFAEEFEVIWSAYPRKPGMSRADTLKAFSARVNEGADVDAMLAGVRAYAGYVHATRTEPKFIKSPETFFGPGKHWESDWTPPANAAQAPQARQAPINEKFNFGHLDRSGDARAMEETIRRHGITVSEDEEIEL